jgi:hypothetical protein
MEGSKLLTYIRGTLQGLISDFQSNPFMYYYERDVQADLYCRLANNWPKTECIAGRSHSTRKGDEYKVSSHSSSPFKCEYPPGKRQANWDIAYVDFRDCGNKNLYRLPVRVAIEIKLCKPGDGAFIGKLKDKNNLENGCRVAEKNNTNFLGIGLWLFQETQKCNGALKSSRCIWWKQIAGDSNRNLQLKDLSDSDIYFLLVPPSKDTHPVIKKWQPPATPAQQ